MNRRLIFLLMLNIISAENFFSINAAAKIISEPSFDKGTQSYLIDKLIKAIQAKDIVQVQELLDDDINLNTKYGTTGSTPLMYAIEAGNIDVVELLLTKDIDINAENNDGSTALNYAIYYNNANLVALLLKKGAYIEKNRTEDNKSIFIFTLNWFCTHSKQLSLNSADYKLKENLENLTSIMKLLIKARVYTSTKAEELLKKYKLTQVSDLIRTIHKLDSITCWNAVIRGKIDKIKNLMESDIPTDNDYLMCLAIQWRKPEIIKMLIKNGVQIEAYSPWVEGENETPLTRAILFNYDWLDSITPDEFIGTIKLLLSENAEIQERNFNDLDEAIESFREIIYHFDDYNHGRCDKKTIDELFLFVKAGKDALKMLIEEKERRVLLPQYKKIINSTISKILPVCISKLIDDYLFGDKFISLDDIKLNDIKSTINEQLTSDTVEKDSERRNSIIPAGNIIGLLLKGNADYKKRKFDDEDSVTNDKKAKIESVSSLSIEVINETIINLSRKIKEINHEIDELRKDIIPDNINNIAIGQKRCQLEEEKDKIKQQLITYREMLNDAKKS